jgi:hypothetical protein
MGEIGDVVNIVQSSLYSPFARKVSNYPENGLMKPPRRDTLALSSAGMFGGKGPLC